MAPPGVGGLGLGVGVGDTQGPQDPFPTWDPQDPQNHPGPSQPPDSQKTSELWNRQPLKFFFSESISCRIISDPPINSQTRFNDAVCQVSTENDADEEVSRTAQTPPAAAAAGVIVVPEAPSMTTDDKWVDYARRHFSKFCVLVVEANLTQTQLQNTLTDISLCKTRGGASGNFLITFDANLFGESITAPTHPEPPSSTTDSFQDVEGYPKRPHTS